MSGQSSAYHKGTYREMIFCNLGSGSKGNSTFIQSQTTSILIDQGFSVKNLRERFEQAGLLPDSVAAILITHEHTDHTRGVGTFARRYKIPVYVTERTAAVIDDKIKKNIEMRHFVTGDMIQIGDLRIKTFHIPHDAQDPIGMVVSAENKRIGILTDIGEVRQSVLYQLTDLNLLFLEANHDTEMLINGSYPLSVKQRIKSRMGHLSNSQSLDLLRRLSSNEKMLHLILGHLSEENNLPDIVNGLFSEHAQKWAAQYKLELAYQHKPGTLIHI